MLDNSNVLKQRDPHGALNVASEQYMQAQFPAYIESPENDGRAIENVVVLGMGGSALSALIAHSWLRDDLKLPVEVVRDYDIPMYVSSSTLVIASSYSGNTEETLEGLGQAETAGAQIGILTSGGQLLDIARQRGISHVVLPGGIQPRMALIYSLRGLVRLLDHFGVMRNADRFDELYNLADWLKAETDKWRPEVETRDNYAKQLALKAVGKSAVFLGGSLTAPLAYKWKISWNENAKNVSFWNQYPEFNHNEFMGWTSHPVEKPFAIFNIISSFEHPQILKRFEISDRLLSGRRPQATNVNLLGDSLIKQLLWGCILADYVSTYVAILNNVDPVPVKLIEELKRELR